MPSLTTYLLPLTTYHLPLIYVPFFMPPPLNVFPLLPGLPALEEVKLVLFFAKGLNGAFLGGPFLTGFGATVLFSGFSSGGKFDVSSDMMV